MESREFAFFFPLFGVVDVFTQMPCPWCFVAWGDWVWVQVSVFVAIKGEQNLLQAMCLRKTRGMTRFLGTSQQCIKGGMVG